MGARQDKHEPVGAHTWAARRARLRDVRRWAISLRLDVDEMRQSDKWQGNIDIAGRQTSHWAALVEWGEAAPSELPMPSQQDMIDNLKSNRAQARAWMITNLDIVGDHVHPCHREEAQTHATLQHEQGDRVLA